MQTDRLYLRISPDLKRRLEALAQADKRQVSDYVRLILEDHTEEWEVAKSNAARENGKRGGRPRKTTANA